MMHAEYKREDHKSYFVICDSRLDENKEEICHDMGMLCENSIAGLLPVSFHSFNGQTELYYDISGKQSLQVLYEKKELRKEDLKILFRGLEEAVSEMENYFLDTECLIIDPEYMYMNVGKQKLYLLYYPFSEENFEESAIRFSDYILDKICNEDEQTVVYAYNFYRLIKEERGDLTAALRILRQDDEAAPAPPEKNKAFIEEEPFYLDDEDLTEFSVDTEEKSTEKKGNQKLRVVAFGFLALFGIGIMAFSSWQYGLGFSELFTKTESVVGLVVVLIAVIGFGALTAADYRIRKKSKIQTENTDKIPEGRYDDISDYHDDSDLFSEEFKEPEEVIEKRYPEVPNKEDDSMFETVLLQENCYSEQRILKGKIRGKTKQIDLAVFPFVIGKSRDQVDFVIEDSSISRIHARFTLRDDIVFLTDLNSTNGTMKNGIRLQPNELVALEAGDEIKIGKVVFTYY